ncbi:uncharacterized protein LOC106162705 [Lingula anatina]|uniref:Uncharacterized protein LOC106162705 n=1 Tax=Lingula anatina TaxID=7574 RepID=A0A1S3IBI2_LINAN|nr:uncharacterized protein LOC106162705 [Lingula anatina]XP_013395528.1 uncharacterized protein LOC106162705 [Lingula anatina]XP_013395529.1 uncharacterized protein LOC106162705 [Lingula anatina]XP_013395530.1 uncharacterized protein LOC106162705 [Lingula anatina]XP_013395531.1 uncharacterized protein LOC106162705 [Lingula anatina]XP_013395532.1 uncharacterized protein LOC106162705 [Lingula anatina]XP_013395533.1 uncharacterized protein LOC106162705 [Lingula anatina]XP_013395534.1 uncharacte|eukprot:XP_013395526.1 uncharacterized protein LOC106162705 [Lingula anatina]
MTYINLQLFYVGVLAPAILTVLLFIGFLICWFKCKFGDKLKEKLPQACHKVGIQTWSAENTATISSLSVQSLPRSSNLGPRYDFKAVDHTDCISCSSRDAYITLITESTKRQQKQQQQGINDKSMSHNTASSSVTTATSPSYVNQTYFINTVTSREHSIPVDEPIETDDNSEENHVLYQAALDTIRKGVPVDRPISPLDDRDSMDAERADNQANAAVVAIDEEIKYNQAINLYASENSDSFDLLFHQKKSPQAAIHESHGIEES